MAISQVPRGSTRAVAVVFFGLFALGAAACGGSGPKLSASGASGNSGASSSGAAGSGATGSGAASAYRACLQDNGVANGGGFGGGQRGGGGSGATGGSGGGGRANGGSGANGFSGVPGTNADGTPRTTVDPAVLAAAQAKCASLAPVRGSGASGGGAALQQQLAPYLSCLGDHGVVVASPGSGAIGSGGTGVGAPGGGGLRGGLGAIDPTDPTFIKANDTCKLLLPDGFDPTTIGRRQGGPPGAAPTTTAAK